jgi:hypothetical protein
VARYSAESPGVPVTGRDRFLWWDNGNRALSAIPDGQPACILDSGGYGAAAWVGIRLAPWIWAWRTICLLLLTLFQFRTTAVG